MKTVNHLFGIAIICSLVLFAACQSEENGETIEGESMESPEAAPQETPEEPQQQPERDPGTVYIDTEYLTFDNRGVATFSDNIFGRNMKYHQFDLAEGEILDVRISSDSEKSMVLFLDPEGNRLVRESFGGPDNDFTWNERFNNAGLYTLQVFLERQYAMDGGTASYQMELRTSWD